MAVDELVEKILDEIESKISQKPSWGKNEVMKIVNAAALKITVEALKGYVK